MIRMCLHCKVKVAGAPRGLCIRCYKTPLVRDKYPLPPSREKVKSRGVGGGVGLRAPIRIALEPTSCLPGTECKVKIMAERASLGVAIFHPLDAGMPALDPKTIKGLLAIRDGTIKYH